MIKGESMQLNNLKIGKKLGIGFFICNSFLIIMCAILLVNYYITKTSLDRLNLINVTTLEKSYIMSSRINELMRIFGLMPFLPENKYKNEKEKITPLREEYRKALTMIKKLDTTDKGKTLLENLLNQIKSAAEKNDTVMKNIEEGRNGEAQLLYLKETKGEVDKILKDIDNFVIYQKKQIEDSITTLNRKNTFSLIISLVIGVSAVIIGIFSSRVISKNIKIPLEKASNHMQCIANGDLTIKVSENALAREDELGDIAKAIDKINSNFENIVTDIKNGMEMLSQTSNRLLNISDELSKSASVSNERTNSVAAASEEMSQTVMDIAKNVAYIAENARKAFTTAHEGNITVEKSIDEVTKIEKTINEFADFIRTLDEKSSHIGNIINTINDIADQINLLALNAAIESARAGEQGRGFAVVADEVRKLAERTAQSTSEIAGTINTIQREINKTIDYAETIAKQVKIGVKLTSEAGIALKNIVKSSDDLQQMTQQIASATEEMSTTAEQISKEIIEVTNFVNSTEKNANNTLNEAKTLSTLSINIKEAVKYFSVDGG